MAHALSPDATGWEDACWTLANKESSRVVNAGPSNRLTVMPLSCQGRCTTDQDSGVAVSGDDSAVGICGALAEHTRMSCKRRYCMPFAARMS